MKLAAPKQEPAAPMATELPNEEPTAAEMPSQEAPADAPPVDAAMEEKPASDKPFDDTPFDAGVEADEETDPKKFIEQLTGKLGQSLRKYTEEKGQPDFELEKFAINSLLSASHVSQMDAEDQKDIMKKMKKSGQNDENMGNAGEEEIGGNEEPTTEPEAGLEENSFMIEPKKLSIYAPEGTPEAEYNKKALGEMEEENTYMFWQNLKGIVKDAESLLSMSFNDVDNLLSDGHAWALDHVARAAESMEQVYHFIDNTLDEEEGEKETNNYMFWGNLKTIRKAAHHILEMDESLVDELLENGHGWAIDHISKVAEGLEHVYHFIDNTLNDEWSKPMEMTSDEPVSDELKYHLDNGIALGETVYRLGSEKFINLMNEVKKLYDKGQIKLNENDEFIINEFDNQYIMVDGQKHKMNFITEEVEDLNEAEYKGKTVQLGKPKRGGSKKFYVYVRDPKSGNIKKVSFGAKSGGGNLAVKLRDPKARKAFSDRHNCPQKTDRTTPGYWACRLPRYAKLLGLSGGGTWW